MADQSRVHFDSAPLPRDTVVAGEPVARLRATLSASDGDLVVRLHDVAPDGTSFVITTGWFHRKGHERPVAVTPGQPDDYEIALWPTHWRGARRPPPPCLGQQR